MNYRIKIEPISEEGEKNLSADLRNGIDCAGFTLIANMGTKTQIVIQRMSSHDLAEAFAGESKFMAAAHIGKAIREARDIEVKPISPLDLMRNLMAQNQKEDMHDEASEDD